MVIQKLFSLFFVSLIHQSNFTRDRSRSAFFRQRINPINLITLHDFLSSGIFHRRRALARTGKIFILFVFLLLVAENLAGNFSQYFVVVVFRFTGKIIENFSYVALARSPIFPLYLLIALGRLSGRHRKARCRGHQEQQPENFPNTSRVDIKSHTNSKCSLLWSFFRLNFFVFFSLCFCSSQLEKI